MDPNLGPLPFQFYSYTSRRLPGWLLAEMREGCGVLFSAVGAQAADFSAHN